MIQQWYHSRIAITRNPHTIDSKPQAPRTRIYGRPYSSYLPTNLSFRQKRFCIFLAIGNIVGNPSGERFHFSIGHVWNIVKRTIP